MGVTNKTNNYDDYISSPDLLMDLDVSSAFPVPDYLASGNDAKNDDYASDGSSGKYNLGVYNTEVSGNLFDLASSYQFGDTIALASDTELNQYFNNIGLNNGQYLVDSHGERVTYDENAPTMHDALPQEGEQQSAAPRRSTNAPTSSTLNDEVLNHMVTRSHEDYWNSEFQRMLDSTKDVNYDALAKKLQSDVEFLSKDVKNSQGQITEWQGQGKEAADAAFNTINSKLDCVLDNIESTIEPACEQIEEFKVKLDELKKGKEELTGADGNGGLDKELELLTKDYEEKKAYRESVESNEPPATIYKENEDGTGHNVTNPDHNAWAIKRRDALSEESAAKELMDKKQEEINVKEAELDLLLDDVKSRYSAIQALVGTVNSFRDGVGAALDGTGEGADLIASLDQILAGLENVTLATDADYSIKSPAVLASPEFFEQACKAHADDGWKVEGNIVTMYINGTECTYDMKRHKFCGDYQTLKNGKQKKVEIEAYFYLPSHVVESGDYSVLENLDTYTFFTSNKKQYMNTINNKEINTLSMMVVKSDPMNSKYGAVANLTRAGNAMAGTNLNKCQNSIGGDSIYGAHSLKLAASTGDLYKTVYCVDNAAIVTGVNGKAGTKEQFASLDDLKGLDNKNIYFINTSGDDNYSMHADMTLGKDGKVKRGRAYVPVSNTKTISVDQVKESFTYTGIELVAQNCPNSKIHIVYQCEDTAKAYQRENFPVALDQLADKYGNVWNDSENWSEYASKLYQTHSQGNYIPHDLNEAASTIDPNHSRNYRISG